MLKIFSVLLILTGLSQVSYCQQAPAPVPDTTKPAAPVVNDDNIVFSKVEEEAVFPGGAAAYKNFLQKNIRAGVPADNKAPAGVYTVIVRFIVHKDGKVSNPVAETNMGYGMEAEVIRLIKISPDWIPAKQNGFVVNAYRRQPVTFVVQ